MRHWNNVGKLNSAFSFVLDYYYAQSKQLCDEQWLVIDGPIGPMLTLEIEAVQSRIFPLTTDCIVFGNLSCYSGHVPCPGVLNRREESRDRRIFDLFGTVGGCVSLRFRPSPKRNDDAVGLIAPSVSAHWECSCWEATRAVYNSDLFPENRSRTPTDQTRVSGGFSKTLARQSYLTDSRSRYTTRRLRLGNWLD